MGQDLPPVLLQPEQPTPAHGSVGNPGQELCLKFGEEYFTSGNYKDYLTRQGKYHGIAGEIDRLLMEYAPRSHIVLDYGCAVGFLTFALQRLGYATHGYDSSEWAVNYGVTRLYISNLTTQKSIVDRPFDVTVCLDVLEHMPLEDIRNLLKSLKSPNLIVRIPVCLYSGSEFLYEVSKRDDTHVTCLTKCEWRKLFQEFGFWRWKAFNGNYIWDTPGVLAALFMRN